MVPTFRKQIAECGPVTVSHLEMTRYFTTIPEAVQLVIQARAVSEGGAVFVLDMGELVKIVDLAEEIIRLSRCKTESNIKIAHTAMRPVGKLSKEI